MADVAITEIPSALKQNTNQPLDGRALYRTIEEALADNPYIVTTRPSPPYPTPTVIETNRFIGQKVMIQNPPEGDSPCEYWFKDGITDSDFVKLNYESSPNIEPNTDIIEIPNVTGTVMALTGSYSYGTLTINAMQETIAVVSGTIQVANGPHTHAGSTTPPEPDPEP